MENKKGAYPNTLTTPETSHNEAIPAHTHQHNTAPQLRLVQHGLKIPNHHAHTHQHQSQTFPSNSHQHIQSSLHQHNPQSFGQNQRHQHYQAEQQFLHQHPQKLHQHQNQTYYQQPNPLNQQNPQIWVPHQPPVHYHSQPPRNEPQPATPPQPIRMERKKSGGNHQQLRSPSAKRPVEAPVTMQGWLHKQGSEGLMLWKKRWFVLSEYCLFYYKGPEEEKLLGSILLPSYKVSMCGPEDKVTRRFAFKCEHANMRTYLLAADSQELMIQWIRVLNMACLLQSNNELEQQQISPSISNPSALNSSESEYHHYKQTSNTPIHMHSSSNTTDLSQQELSQYSQPLYANAPPKPRRLTDGGYSSPSPEVVDRYSAEPKYLPQQYVNRPIYVRKTIAKSPLTVGRKPEYQEYPPQIYCTKDAPQERRTPDTYGRSRLNPATKSRNPSDYEDIYGEQYMYKRPLSPLAYTDRMNQVQRIYTPVMRQYIPAQRRQPPNTIPRPHSADFLEYEVKHQENPGRQQPRPKSSLDINQHNDNYFYSEERYAEKMRKSAQYLPKISKYPTNSIYQESQKYAPLDKSYPLMRSNTQPVNFNQVSVNELPERDSQPIRSRSVLSEGSLSKEVDMDLSPAREAVSPAFGNRQEQIYRYNERKLISNYEQFTRSASARLAQSNVQVDKRQFEGRGANREGERKREESMKRLLEWKQRMLQSPLNRNVDNNYLYKTYPEPYVEIQRSTNTIPQYNSYSSDDEASGSISFNTRDTFPRVIPAKRIWMSVAKPSQARSVGNLSRNHENDYAGLNRQQQGYFMGVSQQDLSSDTSQSSNPSRKKNLQWGDKTNLSAGELLGRTHEELVLLLIQLRRQSTNLCHAIEACYNEIDNIQTKLNTMEAAKRLENLQKLEQIKQHLLELEKQYEKGKPLVNLVDNMVKLGSLYRSPKDRNNFNPYFRDRLEFNQQIQERRLLAEERRDWSRLSPSHTELHAKVQQLYQLDRLIQEESNTLQGLQQDKEEIERALGGLRQRLHKGFNNPAEVEQARKQQIILETELSRVHLMLAENSKKLGETVAGNARLEQELLVLKQKLQVSRQQRSSPQISNAGDSLPCVVGTSAMLESDLQRVQQKVGDLQRQRQELSMQVRQLTDRSNNLQPGRPSSTTPLQNPNKKKMNSLWRETDLDTMNAIDHGEYDNGAIPITPLYINTDLKQNSDGEFYGRKLSDSTSDDTTLTFMPQEKQEIKTVRIVKRESERRQRDREKVATGKWDPVVEEDDSSQNSSVLFRPAPVQKILPVQEKQNSPSPNLSQAYPGTAASDGSLDKSPELSPVFKSEAARQIIIEMANDAPKHTNRRAVPKEKRRHYTAPHNNLIMKSLNQLPTTDSDFDKLDLNGRRARDDLDMERALRQRIDAPDVVRSTLSNKELKYNESTIDNILGTPNKILIPERYIPEQLPQLSVEEQQHRLRKVESIKKMLSDTTIISGSSANLASDDTSTDSPLSSFTNKATTKMIEEKKQREHLLQLNQILAKQVMEMSKIVAGTNNPNEQ